MRIGLWAHQIQVGCTDVLLSSWCRSVVPNWWHPSTFWYPVKVRAEIFVKIRTCHQANTFIDSWWQSVLICCASRLEQSTYWRHFCTVASVISSPSQDSSVPVFVSYELIVVFCFNSGPCSYYLLRPLLKMCTVMQCNVHCTGFMLLCSCY